MTPPLQGAALFLLLGLALTADGLMDSLGPMGFIAAAGAAALLAGLLLRLSGRPQKEKPPAGEGGPNGRQHQRKR